MKDVIDNSLSIPYSGAQLDNTNGPGAKYSINDLSIYILFVEEVLYQH